MKSLLVFGILSLGLLASCGDKDFPKRENEEEVIDKITLRFTPTEGDPIIVDATDADGEGPGNFVLEDIQLMVSTTYTLDIHVMNAVNGISITEEIIEEADEHQFFFAFTNNLFSSPIGNGNVDTASDPINYEDEDGNALPLGQLTTWTTGSAASGTFRIILKHQPGVKSATSGANTGETDIDLTWNIAIVNPS